MFSNQPGFNLEDTGARGKNGWNDMGREGEIQELRIERLNPHEQIIEENLEQVLVSLKDKKRLKEPIMVDKETKVILDGHHRAKAFSRLGLKQIPCRLVDYSSDAITVKPHQNGDVTKEEVMEKGLSDELFAPKTSKHVFELDSEDSATFESTTYSK